MLRNADLILVICESGMSFLLGEGHETYAVKKIF